MNISEVDQSPKVKKAAQLVQDIYHKAGAFLEWSEDGSPTVSSLIHKLKNKFLSSVVRKRDLDLFIDIGEQWLELDANDIFDTTTTGMGSHTELMNDPKYFASEKAKVFKIINMSPQQYIMATKSGFVDPSFTPEEHLVEKYTYKLLAGSKMPMAVLDYTLVEDERRGPYTSFSQEGRHRAFVAEGVGAKSMPVLVIASVYPAWKMKEHLPAFQDEVWSKFK